MKGLLFRCWALAFGVTTGLVLAEAAVRIIKIEDPIRIAQETRMGKGFIGADKIGAKARFKLSDNPRLLYEPNHPPLVPSAKLPDELRVLCLGDSITDNIWQPMRTTFPALLEKILNQALVPLGKRAIVVNAAVTGYNAVQVGEWFNRQWREHEFDWVIYAYCCVNDRTMARQIVEIDGNFWCAMGMEYIPCLKPFPGQGMLLRYSALYRCLSLHLVPILQRLGIPASEYTPDLTAGSQSAILSLQRNVCDFGERFLLVVFSSLSSEEREHGWIMRLADTNRIDCLDLQPIYNHVGLKQIRIASPGYSDLVHPNQRGHSLVANALARKILGQDPPSPILPAVCREYLPDNLLSREGVRLEVSSANSLLENAGALNDANPGSYWHVALDQVGASAWVTIDFAAPKIVRGLTARPRSTRPQQFFRTAQLRGSNDGRLWVPIAGLGEPDLPEDDAWRLWIFDNERPFRFYQIVFEEGHENGPARDFYSLAELGLFE